MDGKRINEVEGEESPQGDGQEVEASSVEIGRVWNIGVVEKREMSRFESQTPWSELEEMEMVCGLCEPPMSISSDSDEDSEPWIKVENKRTKRIQTVETPQKVVPISLKFQVTSVNKPLLSVKRVTEKGNHVSFGPKAEDNFIVNKITGDKILLRPNGKGS